jgi:hypothetical protein
MLLVACVIQRSQGGGIWQLWTGLNALRSKVFLEE